MTSIYLRISETDNSEETTKKRLLDRANIAQKETIDLIETISHTTLGAKDEGVVERLNDSLELLTAGIDLAEKAEFYERLTEVCVTFFGVDRADEKIITDKMRGLIAKVFPDLDTATNNINHYVESEKRAALTSSIHEEIHRLGTVSEPSDFNITTFVNDQLFPNSDKADPKDLLEAVNLLNPKPPEEILNALNKTLTSLSRNGALVHKKMILGTLKKAYKRSMKQKMEPNPQVEGLQDLLKFIHALETHKVDLAHFHIVDYLRDYMPEDDAINLIGAQPLTLSSEITRSRYNGNHLLTDKFTAHAEEMTLSRDVVNSISPEDFESIVNCLAEIAKGNLEIDELCLRTGIGASAEAMPLRILAYIIPALTIARRFNDSFGKSPQIEFFTGEEGGMNCNNMDPEVVKANTKRAFEIVDRFVETFYPDIANNFALANDKEWGDQKNQLVISYLESVLSAEAETTPQLAKILDELRRRGATYGGETGARNAVRYAAFHAICFRDIPAIDAYLTNKAQSGAKHIISIGGTSEMAFDYIRDILANKFSVSDFNNFAMSANMPDLRIESDLPPLDTRSTVIANTGAIPPYFLVREGGDVALEEIDELEADAIRDLLAQRIHRALEITLTPEEHVPRTVASAKSFLQGIALISATIGREGLINFLLNSSDVQQK